MGKGRGREKKKGKESEKKRKRQRKKLGGGREEKVHIVKGEAWWEQTKEKRRGRR